MPNLISKNISFGRKYRYIDDGSPRRAACSGGAGVMQPISVNSKSRDALFNSIDHRRRLDALLFRCSSIVHVKVKKASSLLSLLRNESLSLLFSCCIEFIGGCEKSRHHSASPQQSLSCMKGRKEWAQYPLYVLTCCRPVRILRRRRKEKKCSFHDSDEQRQRGHRQMNS